MGQVCYATSTVPTEIVYIAIFCKKFPVEGDFSYLAVFRIRDVYLGSDFFSPGSWVHC
jgi:hypothetical protein